MKNNCTMIFLIALSLTACSRQGSPLAVSTRGGVGKNSAATPSTHLPPGFGDYGPVHADSLKGKKSCWAAGGSRAKFVWEFEGDRFTIREEDGPIPDDALIAILGGRQTREVKTIIGKWALNDAERTMTLTGITADGKGEFKDVTLKLFNTGVVRVNLNDKQYVFSPLR